MKRIIFAVITIVLASNVLGQRFCGSQLDISELQKTDPARYQRIMALESQLQTLLRGTNNIPTSTITIPVVVHVVYNSAQNISDAQMSAQMQVLNEDYRRLNANRVNTPAVWASVAGDANIEFKLAKIDSNGNPTIGITRTPTTVTGFSRSSDYVKFTSTGGHNAWNTLRYLNIWVCNLTSPSGIMGYSTFPDELLTNPNLDGVVINYIDFGVDGHTVYPYNKGRTTTHEVGHWLNLYHIWGTTEGNCTSTDEVADTPNQYQRTYGCPSFPETDLCSTVKPGIMFMNYMDYSDDACMNLFTNGQIERMRALFDTQIGIRKEMLIDAECLANSVNFINQSVTTNTTITSPCDIYVQDVTVSNNVKLMLDATRNVTIDGPFKVPLGSQLVIN